MRSIRYILGMAPHKLEDCLEEARKQPVTDVTLNLIRQEAALEFDVMTMLDAEFVWTFRDFTAVCRKTCGVVRETDTPVGRAKGVAAANWELTRLLDMIALHGINVSNPKDRFDLYQDAEADLAVHAH